MDQKSSPESVDKIAWGSEKVYRFEVRCGRALL